MTVNKIPIVDLAFELPEPTLEDIAGMVSHRYSSDIEGRYCETSISVVNRKIFYNEVREAYRQGFLAGLNYKFTGEWDTKEEGK